MARVSTALVRTLNQARKTAKIASQFGLRTGDQLDWSLEAKGDNYP